MTLRGAWGVHTAWGGPCSYAAGWQCGYIMKLVSGHTLLLIKVTRMPKSLQGRLSFLFLSLVLLILISVGGMYWGLETQRQGELVLHLSGRQAMLAEQMAHLAYSAGQGQTASNAVLQEIERQFDEAQTALQFGGTAPYPPGPTVTVPVTGNPQITASLDQVSVTWTQARSLLDALQRTSPDAESFTTTLQATERTTTQLAEQADAVAHLYEADATAQFHRLILLQAAVLGSALILLAAGAVVMRQSVMRPLDELGKAAARLAQGDLGTAIRVQGPTEIAALSRSFETMRVNLGSSRQELTQMNVDLEEHIAQRTRELELLNDISREISSRLDIQQVLNSVTEKARSLLGGEVASLCLVDENRHWLKLQAISGPRGAVSGWNARADDQLAGVVLESDQALACGVGHCHGECQILSSVYRVSHMAAPLRTADRVVGALCVGSLSGGRFAADSVALLTKLANTAAIALENARLYAQAERVATLEERHRVAAEMHDGLGQTLSYLGLMTDQVVDFLSRGQDAEALARLAKAREAIGGASLELRRAINSLMDESPADSDLCSRLRTAVEKFAADNALQVSWTAPAGDQPKCPRATAEQVLNIALEALNNVARHAQAQRVGVALDQTDNCYSVSVEDDGQGFDTSEPEPSGHFGLQIMQTRAMHIGGQLQIESSPGHGTRITLTWPMDRKG